MLLLRLCWICHLVRIYAADSSSSMIGHVYNQMSYRPASVAFSDPIVTSSVLCAAQCAFHFATCMTAVFDRSAMHQCLLYDEAVTPANLIADSDAVVYDFQQNKFQVTPCSALFRTQKTYSTGSGSSPVFVSLADVSGDNEPDIIFANDIIFTPSVGVLFNYGNGTFRLPTSYSTGTNSHPQCVSGRDVNGDGKIDIIAANNGGNNVGVFLNGGNGTFLSQTTYSTGFNTYPPSVSGADVNNDGAPDIVVANQKLATVGVLLNFGNGTFRSQTTYSTGVGGGPTSVVVTDVNADGKPDIIVANYNTASVGLLFNFGNGTFLPVTTYSTGNNSMPRSVFVADVNNDNKPDLVVANQNANNVGVLFNVGNGTFGPQRTYYTGNNSSPISVFVADVNSDNKPDILVAHFGTSGVGLLLNVGDGTFLPQTTCSLGTNSQPHSISMTDVNNDNKVDVIVANSGQSNIGVLLAV